ncbi:MAG: hypothetical protein HQL05_13650 [Nitrospirae bacterium]|nr:hypothetical protein [Nitrospirota bacterium]
MNVRKGTQAEFAAKIRHALEVEIKNHKGDKIMTRRIVKPNNCALAFAIPLDEKSFEQNRKVPDREYIRMKFKDDWNGYYIKVARIYENFKTNFQQLGVNVFYNVTFDCFKGLLEREEFDVIIPFAHFNNKESELHKPGMEFFDGFATIPEIVDAVPYDFTGILDLDVCNSEPLVVKLKEKNLKYLIKSGYGEATPVVWMGFYLMLFRYLYDNNATYIEALEETSF